MGASVPVLLWEITPSDEEALDRYEGWPHFYRKETLEFTSMGEPVEAMAYIMNDGRQLGLPSPYYYNVIAEGYESAGFDPKALADAVWATKRAMLGT
jgi:hypothetical protein